MVEKTVLKSSKRIKLKLWNVAVSALLFVHVEERQETKPEALIAAECNYGAYLWEG